MRFGVDIDGTVADFAGPANRWLARFLQQPLQPIDRWDWYMSYDDGQWGWDELWRDVYGSHFMRDLDAEPYATDGVNTLLDMGHEVVMVTARPERLTDDTRHWLDHHGMASVPLHMGVDFKHEVECDVYFDDAQHHVDNLRDHHKTAVLNIQPWNVKDSFDKVRFPLVAYGWQDFLRWVEEFVGRG